ncbi:MAG: hypothetical protein ACXWNZ_17300 [Vulcanimicrobiaceae bacterium]
MRSVIVTGFPVQAAYLSQLLNESAAGITAAFYPDTRFSRLRAAARAMYADASITFGGPRPNALQQMICNGRRCPAIVLWAGTDVRVIAQTPHELEPLRLRKLIHWACAPNLVDELATLGIEARYVPVASACIPGNVAPMPSAFTVLTYLPKPRRVFYGQDLVWEAARALPDARFIVVGRGEPEPNAPSNVEYLGHVDDMDDRMDAASVLLRFPEHDGLPAMMIEALARARHVIWTSPFPGVIHAPSRSEAISALAALREAHREGTLRVNEIGLRHVASNYDPGDIARGVVTALDEAIEMVQARTIRSAPRHRLAISGHEVFCARVAANCRAYANEISGSVLTTYTASDTVVSALELFTSDAWYTIGQPVGPRAFELAAFLSHKPRVLHWLGSDIDVLRRGVRLLHRFRSRRFTHLAQNEVVALRLSELGLHSRVVPLPAVSPVAQLRPLPQVFTLLMYLPAVRPEFYGRYQYERLMQTLSHEPIRYIIVGGGKIDVPACVDAEQLGWRCDLGEVYDRSTALVRFTQPDSLSTMVVEALLHGRHVLWSNDFPFVVRVHDYVDLVKEVRTLLQRHSEGLLTPQTDAAVAMNKLYSPERCLHLLAEACGCRIVMTSPAADGMAVSQIRS